MFSITINRVLIVFQFQDQLNPCFQLEPLESPIDLLTVIQYMYEKISSIIHNEPKFQQQSKDHVSLGKMGFDFGPMRGEERSEKSAKLST